MNKNKHIFLNGLIDLAQSRLGTKIVYKTDEFFAYLKDSFDALYEEGKTKPKMMSLGLHCRLIGRPGRIQSLKKFLDYVLKHDDVWICKRIDIANHWIKNYQNL